ncbi:MAG: S8 family serine peptidase, partial [Xanthomonadales bacterium]|nr:S8 family serine peptidase [Xanthomonadales bacterium]
MALDLTEAEAAELARSTLLQSITRDTRQRLDTDAGPEWIGAGDIWNGLAGYPEARGENIVVGVIDSGINWEHPSFSDPSGDGYDHVNPFGEQLGLCDDPEVECNDKLIGVYDFVEDDPSTDDVVEENTKGRDNDGHGSHVASIAAGNRANVVLNGSANATLSGVAPRANLVTYRVCFVGEPAGADTGGCAASAILSAIDQAVEDGVAVINYSIGSSPSDPWANGSIA